MEPRNTFRRGCCLQLLQNGPMLFCELKWRTWIAEWKAGRTKFVCSKSAVYNRSFKRSIHLWQNRGDLTTHVLKSGITYGLAARLAVFTALERGQLSSPEPARAIRLYFDGIWCSVVVYLGDGIRSKFRSGAGRRDSSLRDHFGMYSGQRRNGKASCSCRLANVLIE